MSGQVVRRPEADEDLVEHFAFISQDNQDAAERFVTAARKTFTKLADMPRMGTPYKAKNEALAGLRRRRISGFHKYLIFYLARDDGIEVVRVIRGGRDYDKLFGS